MSHSGAGESGGSRERKSFTLSFVLSTPAKKRVRNKFKDRFMGEGRSRQEDAETSCRPGWAQPKQTPSPSFNQPRGQALSQVRSYSERLPVVMTQHEKLGGRGGEEGAGY